MQIPQQIQLSLIQAVGKVQKGVSVIVGMGNKMGGGRVMALFIEISFLLFIKKNKHNPPHTKNMLLKINNEAMFG